MLKSHLILLLCLILSQPVHADFNGGVVAYLMADYDKAYSTMRALAESANHSYAQYYVGMMYLNGQGVKQDYEKAGHWFRKASEQAIPQAQFKLGTLYLNGQGLPKDYEFAYGWYRVASSHNHKRSVAAVEELRDKLSAEGMKEAEKLSLELIRKYGPRPTAEKKK